MTKAVAAAPEPAPGVLAAGESLGLKPLPVSKLIRQVERGLPFRTLRVFAANSGIDLEVLAAVAGIPEKMLARRKQLQRLEPHESERLVRLSIVFEKTVRLFEGDRAAAVKWLLTPRRALDNHTPLAYARTDLGAREVENLIGRLEHGVFS